MTGRVWSDEHKAIFAWFANRSTFSETDLIAKPRNRQHLIVQARAGATKTSTIIEALNYAPEKNIALCAFNNRIAAELKVRITNPKARAMTLHSLGFAAVRQAWEGLRVDKEGNRKDDLTNQVCTGTTPDVIKRLVTKLHTMGREMKPHATQMGELAGIQSDYDLEPDLTWLRQGYDAQYVERKALEAMDIAGKVKPVATGIDYTDMIFLPCRNGWTFPQFDLVITDEMQDMTVAQLEIALGSLEPDGRFVGVGDNRQAIYGFRGADSGSMGRIQRELNADQLTLTTTYRCAKNIVTEAQVYVPDIRARDTAAEGSVEELGLAKMYDEAAYGDFILSRVNAPLVPIAMKLIRQGKRARIAGRDIGAGLKGLLRKFRCSTVDSLLIRIDQWEEAEVRRWQATKQAESKINSARDRADMLRNLCEDRRTVREVEDYIDLLFTDDGLGTLGVITCSSVHKAKGLEANRVFTLEDTFFGKGDEEDNIRYVAITRAMNTLVRVYGRP